MCAVAVVVVNGNNGQPPQANAFDRPPMEQNDDRPTHFQKRHQRVDWILVPMKWVAMRLQVDGWLGSRS